MICSVQSKDTQRMPKNAKECVYINSKCFADQMPPTNGPGFCKYVAGVGANVLFDPKAAEALKTSAKTQGLASTEDASGKFTACQFVCLLCLATICSWNTNAFAHYLPCNI